MCATHGVRLLSLLHTLCIPLFLQWSYREKQQGKAGSDRTVQMLRKLLRQTKTKELFLGTSKAGKCSGTCLCCFAGAKESTEIYAVTLYES